MVVNPSGRILTATVAVLSCLALLWVYTNIEFFAASNVQSAGNLILPVWATDEDETVTEPSEDDDTPTPTLTLTESSSSSETDTATDPYTSELIEATYKDPVAQEPKKPDYAARSDAPLPGASDTLAGRPAGYPVLLPKVESPSLGPPSSENTAIFSQEDPFQGSTDLANDVTAQPLPAQTSPPTTPEVTEASPQTPLDVPAGTQTSPQPPLDLPADAGTPSQLPSPSNATTPSDLSPDPSLVTDDMGHLE